MGSFLKKASFGFALPFALLSLMAAQTPTTTTLSIGPANYVAAGTVVTLTATVTNPGSVTAGTVDFCNADSTDCSPGSGLYGTAQLTSSGTASILKVFGYGANNIKAVFAPTVANAGSTSLTNFVTVAAGAITNTSLTAAGSPGNYTLSGAVTAFGTQPLSGVVNFLDTTSGNVQIGTSSLGASVRTYSSVPYPVGHTPYGVVVGDFNRDGKVDLAVTNATDNKVSILLGNGNGTFQPQATYNVGGQPGPIAVGDFNGDGKLDLAVGNLTGQTISVLIGNGDGTFRPQITYSTSGVTPISIAVGDFTGAGKLDIVIADYPYSTVQIMIGNGDGTFQPGLASTGTAPVAIAPGHFDGSGWLEIVEYGQIGGGDILQGGSAGFFASLPGHFDWDTYAPTYYASSIAVGDFNRDGKLDLAVTDPYDNKVTIMLESGAASFGGEITIPSNSPLSVAVGDFNGDGKLDLAVTHPSDNKVGIILGNGDGTFQPEIGYGVGSSPYSVAVGDFNGDGIPDLAVTNAAGNTVSILFSEQIANYSQSGISAIGSGTQYVLASYLGDSNNSPSQSTTVPLVGTSLPTQTISFAPIPSPVTFGIPPITLSATGGATGNPVIFSVLSGPGHVVGNLLYVDGVGTIVVAANQAGNADYSDAPQVTQSVVVNAATPSVSLSCSPNPITYGSQNTTCTASVGGGATGTVSLFWNGNLWATPTLSGGTASGTGFAGMGAGTYSITAFYGGDPNNNGGSAGTTLTIVQASQSITFIPPPSPVTYGVGPISLSASSSSGLGVTFSVISGPGSISGNTLTVTGAGTILVAANQSGNGNYLAAPQVTQAVIVNKATPTITWATPAAITYGTALSGAQLNATSGGVAGSFAYAPSSSTVLSGGTHTLSVTFTPTDSVDYNNQIASVNLTVNQAVAGVSVSCAPNPITYGSQTTNCTAAVGGSATGTVTWTINGGGWTSTGLSGGATSAGGFNGYAAGSYTIGVTYSGDGNYAAGTASTTLTVNKANPPLNWIAPANITYGTPLSGTQLDPTSGGVAGTFVFSPVAGTVLPVGSHLLSATFTPTDSTDYNQLTIITTVVVVPAAPGINVNCAPNPITYGPQTSTCTAAVSAGATGSVAFFYNGTNWANVPVSGGAASATGFSNMPVGSYTIVANYSGDSNFNPASAFTTLTIGQAAPAVTLSCSPTSISLGSNTTCTASVPATDGTVAFYSTADLAGKWWNGPFPAGGGDLGTTPVATTQDGSLNYNISGEPWASAIAGPAGVNATNIYARWTGTFVSPADGTYTIGVNSDDGANVYVNGTLLVGNLSAGQGATSDLAYTQSGTLALTMGTTNTIVVEYQQGGGQAGIQLLWTPPGASSASLLGWTVVPVNSSGQASITGGSAWNAGTYNVSSVYSGDANYSAATSNVVAVTVNQATPTVTVTCSPNTMVFGSTASCTAHVSAGTGTVTFSGGASQPGPWVETVDGSGNAVLTGFSNWAAGTYTVQATYSGDSNYSGATRSSVLTITTSTPVLSWATPAAITYGTPLSATQLNATSGGVAGTFTYTPAAETILAAGSQTLSVTFTPTDTVDYATQTATVTLVVNKAPLTVTPNPATRLYGAANPALSGTITGLMAGDVITPSYSTAATTSTAVGVYISGPNAITYALSDPANKLPNYTLTQTLGTFTITQATTVLTWANPAAITYGTALSAAQLNATSGGVAGTFVYTPPTGTILPVGVQTLSVTFTPTDGADYSAATATVSLTVTKAPLTVTPTPASKVYGTANPTFTGSITGLVAGDIITATYASAATTSTAVGVYSSGVNAITATLADPGSKLSNYILTQNVGALTITQATTTLTWATPAAITYGTPLSAAQLNATSGGVAGTFVYSSAAGAVLAAGSQTLSVMFTPTDTADYGSQIATVNLQVNKAVLVVTPNPASRLYAAANPVFTGTITGMIAGDGISATYASGANATIPVGVYSAGANAIAPTLIDPGSKLGNYTVTQNLGALTITQVTTGLTWATPAAITYGTPLSGTQLNSTSGGVAGTFVYSPAAGAVLSAGAHPLNVTFTPTDGVDYSTATASVTLTVNPAVLTVTPSLSSKIYGTANPVFTGSITGMIPGDGISATYSSAATATTVVGVYASGPNAIVATLSDPQSKLGNYTLNQTAGTFTITQATTVLTWATPASISYETALSSTQLDATSGGVAGTFVYTPAAGTVLSAGSHTLSVAFTPTDAVDYSAATATVTLTVTKTTPTVILTSLANPSVYGGSVTFTATTNAAGAGTVLFYDGGSLLGPGTISGGVATYTLNSLGGGTHSISASYAGDSNYLSALSAALSQVVTKSPVTITVTSSVNPSNFGQSVTFTFTVTGVAGLATPTGSIAFTDGGTLIASPVLNPLGVATYTTVTLSGGSHSLAAVYGGDANYQ
jgi:hypothetical protein